MSKRKLNDDDFCRAAKRLRCEPAAIRAVAEVESRGEGFYADGFPVILFERHKFRSFTHGKYNDSHPQISGPAGEYGSPGQNQKNKFNLAFKLDPEAAMKSCSWGKFQIMGFNHELCGFPTVGEFVDAMKESEGRQLDAFVSFVIKTGLADELRRHDWAGFAEGYNGAGYKANKYDTKMAAAYKRFAKNEIDCDQVSAGTGVSHPSKEQTGSSDSPAETSTTPAPPDSNTAPPASTVQQTLSETQQTGDGGAKTEQTTVVTEQPKGDHPASPPTQVTKNGPLAKWLAGGGGLTAVGTFVWGYIQSNPSAVAIAILCITLLIVVVIFRGAITDAIRMQTAADVDKKNVT